MTSTDIGGVYDRLLDQRQPQDPKPPAPQPDVYDQILDRRRQAEDQLLMQSFSEAVKANPDLAGEAQRLGIEVGMEPQAAERNIERVRQLASAKQARLHDLARLSPVLARQLRDPQFARIAHDQTLNLSFTEDLLANWEAGKLTNERGFLGEKVRTGAATQDELRRLAFVNQRLQDLPSASSGLLTGASKLLGQMVPTTAKAVTTGLAYGLGAAGATAIAGQTGPQIALPEEILTVPAAAGLGFTVGMTTSLAAQSYAIEAGNAYLDMLDMGLDQQSAGHAAFGVGIVNAALELTGVGFVTAPMRRALRETLAKDVVEALAKPTAGKALGRFVTGYATGVGGEVLTEVMQEVANIVGERAAGATPKEGDETISQRLATIAAETAKGMALLGLPGPGMQLHRDAQRVAAAERQTKFFEDLSANATESEVRKRNPEAYQGVVGQMARGTAAENVYVDGAKFAETLQQLGLTREQLNQTVANITQQIDEAVATGSDVVIPTSQYAARIAGTDLDKALLPHMRLDPDGWSAQEAEEWRANEKQHVAEAAKAIEEIADTEAEFIESARAVEDQMRAQLVATGKMSDADARSAAKFYRDFTVVMAREAKVLPGEFHAQRGLKVAAGEAPQGALQQAGIPTGFGKQFDTIRDAYEFYQDARSHGDDEAMDAAHALATEMFGEDVAQEMAEGGDSFPVLEGDGPAAATDFAQAVERRAEKMRAEMGGGLHKKDAAGTARASFDPAALTAILHEKADASSFLHEASHYFLTLYGERAALPDASPRIQQDMQTLLDWFGVKDLATWNAMSLEQQRKHHEAFAYNFETWLHDGKAPSVEMEWLFRRFAQWLRRVYRSIRDELGALYRKEFGTELPLLTGEVRGVMERMLASEEQIAHAEAVRGMAPVFQTQAESKMGDVEWATYQMALEDARESAVLDLTRASLRQMKWLSGARSRVLKAMQKDTEETRDAMRAEVVAEVQAQPVHRARVWLKQGRMVAADGTMVQGDADQNHKLRTQDVQSMALGGVDTEQLRGFMSERGLSADTVAGMFGFDSGEALVRALLSEPAFGDAIDQRTDERMLAEHAELVDPKEIDRAVEAALHNEARARFVAIEYQHLAKLKQPVRLVRAAVREAARQILGGKRIRDIGVRQFSAAEARAAREVTAASKKGKVDDMLAAERRRMIQGELAKQAEAVEAEVEKARAAFARFAKPDEKLAKTLDLDYVNAGRVLAAAYGLGDSAPNAQEADIRQRAIQSLLETAGTVHARLAPLLTEAVVHGRDFRNLTLDQFRDLADVAETLWDQSRRSRLLDAEGRKGELAEAVGELGVAIGKLPPRSPTASAPTGETPGPLRRRILSLWHALASLKRMQHWARFMDGGKDGPFQRFIVAPIMRRLDDYNERKAKFVGKYHERLTALAEAAGSQWDAKIQAPELGYTFKGKKELVGALLHAGTQSNLQKLLVGRQWGALVKDPVTGEQVLDTAAWDRFLARMFKNGKLTKQDVDFVRFVWDSYRELLPQAQATHKALYGYEYETLEQRPLVTPFGTLDGGYVPARVDRDAVDAPRRHGEVESIEGLEQDFLYSVSTGKGFTIERNPNYNQPLDLNVARQLSHIDAELRFIYLQPVIKDALRIVRNHEFAKALNAYDREAVNGIIMPWLENTAQQATTRPGANQFIDWLATVFRQTASLAALGFNVINALIQVTGLSNARTEVQGKYMRSALNQWRKNPRAAVRAATDKSRAMERRLDQSVRKMSDDVQRLAEPGLLGRGPKMTQQTASRLAFFPQRLVQSIADVVTWHGAYAQYNAEQDIGERTKEQFEADAVEAADAAVKRAQGSQNPEDIAAYEAGTPLAKLLVQFGSYSNVVLNQVLAAGKGKRAQAALWAILLPALAEGAIRQAMLGGPEDEDDDGTIDDWAAVFGKAALRNATGLVPALGPMLLSLAESDGNRMAASPAGTMLQAAARGVFAAIDAASGEPVSGSDARNLATVLTLLSGLPFAPAGRVAGYRLDVEAGKAEPSGTADYLRGLVVGR